MIRRLVRAVWLVGETLAAVCRLAVAEWGLRRTTLPDVCAALGVRLDLDSAAMPATEPAVLPHWSAVPLRACLGVAERWPAGDTCLRRCLVVGHRLRALDPVLRIGVRRDPAGGFHAHSWLELSGRTLDAGAADFATLGGLR